MTGHKLIRIGLLTAAVVLGAMQLVRPDKSNPPVKPELTLAAQYDVPPHVSSILERACADCHSNRTTWPWYSHLAPASWLLVEHVRDGRRHFNLDDFNEEMSLKDVCQEVRVRSMPLKGYLALHPNARISDNDIATICAWSASPRPH